MFQIGTLPFTISVGNPFTKILLQKEKKILDKSSYI